MEDYGQLHNHENSAPRDQCFLYGGGTALAPTNSSPNMFGRSAGGGEFCFDQPQTHRIVKTEASSFHRHGHKLQYPLLRDDVALHYQEEISHSPNEAEVIKAKIVAHPHCSNLLEAYMDCQRVGAPPEVMVRLTAAREEFEMQRGSFMHSRRSEVTITEDPELDQFMEAYYDMLVKYREELTRPLQEAMDFMRRIESQLKTMSNFPVRIFSSDQRREGAPAGSSEEEPDQDISGGEAEVPEFDPRAEDRELKNHLLRKYSGYLSSLKQELSKKRKKGKLPKDARQKLLTWWELHYKWPYPSETEKVALAESTGLDQKQINNWFINQRKRHWKPSEDMQFMVMDGGLHPQNSSGLYMEAGNHYNMGDGAYR